MVNRPIILGIEPVIVVLCARKGHVNGFESFRDPSIQEINRTEKENGRTREKGSERTAS
jgi:hypothetical protein